MSRAKDFDDNNLWHRHFFVMLEVRCADCNAFAVTNDLYARRLKSRRDDALEKFCVLATESLQQKGWLMIDERGVFRCPDCSRRSLSLNWRFGEQ